MDETIIKHREGSLDWWMALDGPPTDGERAERARLVKLCVLAWDAASRPDLPATQTTDTPSGFPANFVCGHLADACAELMGIPRDRVITKMQVWANNRDRVLDDGKNWLDARIRGFFFDGEWTR